MNATPRLRMASTASNGTTPIAALAYRGIHDIATRTRILGWLMQRYQVTPPPRWIALLSAAVALIWCWHAEGRSSKRYLSGVRCAHVNNRSDAGTLGGAR